MTGQHFVRRLTLKHPVRKCTQQPLVSNRTLSGSPDSNRDVRRLSQFPERVGSRKPSDHRKPESARPPRRERNIMQIK